MQPSHQEPSEARPLSYTGHPFVDIGLATIAAYSDKESPADITSDDLAAIADYMRRNYVVNPLRSFLTVVFPNSGFTQPAYNKHSEKREVYADHVLDAYAADTLDELDIFLGLPVANVSYDVDGKLEPGRVDRRHIPLLTGKEVINFVPGGEPSLFVSGLTMLTVQAFPLGCKKCVGRLLAVHSDNPDILQYFASRFLRENLQSIKLAQEVDESKLREPGQATFTLLIDTLLDAARRQGYAIDDDERPFSITAYHLSNSGQGPSLDIYHLPFQITGFLRQMQRDTYRREWQAIENRAWQRAPARQKKGQPFVPRYNTLYEDLFSLPQNAPRFIRTYFLRIRQTFSRDKQDPRSEYSSLQEAGIVSWKITELFLKGVMNMDKERVEQIRLLGDRLADYVNQENDRSFFRLFYTTRRYTDLRTLLLRANLAAVRRGDPPIIEFDPYIAIFEDGESLPNMSWRLSRDLVLIRMIERLHKAGWLDRHVEDIPDRDVESEDNED